MAVVIHYPNGKDKPGYAYDHHRVGKRVVCTYLGLAEVHIQQGLRDDGFRDKPGYKERHGFANNKEKQLYGKEKFDKLQAIIDKRLDKGELAGKYQGDKIIINEKMPGTYHNQIRDHELWERYYHEHIKE